MQCTGFLDVDTNFILSISAIAIAVFGWVWSYFRALTSIDKRLTLLEKQNEIFWSVVVSRLGQVLTHSDNIDVDYLLSKAREKSITSDEEKMLIGKIESLLVHKNGSVDGESVALTILLAGLKSRIT